MGWLSSFLSRRPTTPKYTLVKGRKISYMDYELTVRHRGGRIQMYRTAPYPGVTYPQGESIAYDFELREWIEQQITQFEWSKEYVE